MEPNIHSSTDPRSHRASLARVGAVFAVMALALPGLIGEVGSGPRWALDSPAGERPGLGPACGGSPPPSRPVWVSDRSFKKVVLRAEVPVLVEFGAVWCLPCRKLVPALDALAADFVGRALVARVDIDADPYLAQDLAVDNLPTMILFLDGRPVRRLVGNRSREELAGQLDRLLAEPNPLAPDSPQGTAAAAAG